MLRSALLIETNDDSVLPKMELTPVSMLKPLVPVPGVMFLSLTVEPGEAGLISSKVVLPCPVDWKLMPQVHSAPMEILGMKKYSKPMNPKALMPNTEPELQAVGLPLYTPDAILVVVGLFPHKPPSTGVV